MNHPETLYVLAKIKQAEMRQEADNRRLLKEANSPSFPIHWVSIALVIAAAVGAVAILVAA